MRDFFISDISCAWYYFPMQIILPNPSKKRALFIVDVQSGFETKRDAWIIPNVVALIKEGDYALFVDAVFHADKNSLWDKETRWTMDASPTVPEIKSILDPHKTVFVTKETKSIWIADPHLVDYLKSEKVEEIHVVGYDINDCVMCTANDAFDFGFSTYVIEEAADSSESDDLRNDALAILRENEMTNHSELINEKKILAD
ncbi:MAG: hydrolase [Patescibacteria group bacterium]|nr:hydrolase [Patescibacteria group bacterium]